MVTKKRNSTPDDYSNGSSGRSYSSGLSSEGSTSDPRSYDDYKPVGKRRSDEPQGSSGSGFTVRKTGSYQGESPSEAVNTTHFSDDPEEKKRRK